MLNYLETYCAINSIEPAETVLAIGAKITENPTKKIIGLSHQSYVFQGFQQLLNEGITLEEFMSMGDIVSKKPVTMPGLSHEACAQIDAGMKLNSADWKGVFVLIDQEALVFAKSGWKEEAEKLLEEWGSNLFVL